MRSFLALFVLVGFAMPAAAQMPPRSAQTPPGWIADARTGCRVWNAGPQPGETVSWTGGCRNDDLAQGRGVLQWFKDGKPGDRYEGEFRDGKRQGRAVVTFANGNRYDGEFRDDYANGRGVFTFVSGNRYDGEYRDGKRTGRGVFTFADGSRYEGEFLDDFVNGSGTLKRPDGATYSGTWTSGCYRQGGREMRLGRTAKECGFQ